MNYWSYKGNAFLSTPEREKQASMMGFIKIFPSMPSNQSVIMERAQQDGFFCYHTSREIEFSLYKMILAEFMLKLCQNLTTPVVSN